MIKYNIKAASEQEIHLQPEYNHDHNPPDPDPNHNAKLDESSSSEHRETSFHSPDHRERYKHHNFFPQKRSKSHKISYDKINKSKLRNEISKKREGKGSKMELLVIIPNQNKTKEIQSHMLNQSALDNFNKNLPKNGTLNNTFQEKTITQPGQKKSNIIREDIAIGKMKLLAHKSKLSPITQKSRNARQLRLIHRSEQKLNDIERVETMCYNRIIRDKEREMKEQYLKNENSKYSPTKDRYIKTAEGIHLINIQSIIPNISIAEKLTLQLKDKQKRRTTEPNLDTAEQFYQITEQNIGTIYDHKAKECANNLEPIKNEFNFNYGRDRNKIYAQKLKSYQWKKKIFLSNLTKFILPYETYHYRDMLWKINYSNRLFVEPPLEYEHRLKAYVGKGNNSSMVRGLISRRYWFAITDRIQQANFVWTQLKEFRYFNIQKGNSNEEKTSPPMSQFGSYVSKSLILDGDIIEYKRYCERNKIVEEHSDQRMLARLKWFNYHTVIRSQSIRQARLHNHLINNYIISNKKSLFRVLSTYYKYHQMDPFNVIPITYHICKGIQDPVFLAFQKYYHQQTKQIRKGESNRKNYWIVKPGENSNRGNGIKLCFKLSQIKAIIREKGIWADGSEKTYIIQSYIENPLLYFKRKFDIRHYILLTCVNGQIKGYWYEEGYVRTTSSQYTLEFNSSNVHLTNDAIQKYLPNYGKFEKGNKLSYNELDLYIRKKSANHDFFNHIYPQMKKIGIDIMKASANYLDPKRLNNNFELFGLDFMIDDRFKVWLIEVNSNPCLQLSCPLLSIIIPNLIQNVLEITMDAHFPPAMRYSVKIPRYLGRTQELNKFELVFDQRAEPMPNFEQNILDDKLLKEQDDEFEDNNSEWEDNV